VTVCLNCGCPSASPLGYGYGDHDLKRCAECRLTYWPGWSPVFDQSHDTYYADRSDNYLSDPITEKRLEQLFAYLGSMVTGRRLLDVGCGWGEGVAAAGRAGWDAFGVDLSQVAVDSCVGRGLDCRHRDFFDISPLEGLYDVIIMSELIEHVPFPKEWFSHARSLLTPEGVLYLTTPNFNSLGRRVLSQNWAGIGSGHIAYFTAEVLRSLTREAGLLDLKLTTRNPSVSALLKLARFGRGAAPTNDAQYGAVQSARVLASRHPVLKSLQYLVNVCLNITGTGETLVGVFRPR